MERRSRRLATVTAALLSLGLLGLPPASATFPGDAGQIAYEDFVGGGLEIFTMNADGTNRGPVTSTPTLFEQNPSWAPDGSKIIFNSFGDSSSDIEMMDPDGGNRVKLTSTGNRDEYSPVFSPDGTRVAFVRYDNLGEADVWAMNLDGTDLQNLTNNGIGSSGIDWRPDGNAIVYTGLTPNEEFAIYQFDFATGQSTQLTEPGVENSDDFLPDYSPDGAQIAYLRYGPDETSPMVVDVDGSNEVVLAHEAQSIGGISWSPEGDRIAISENGDPNEITLVLPDGSPDRSVIVEQDAGELAWQPCTDDCTISGARPSITELYDAYRSSKRKTTVVASVSPTTEGATVTFDIYKRRDGRFRKIFTDSAPIDDVGNASVSFRVSKKGRCKAKATFEGTAESAPSSDSLKFRCKGFSIG